MKTILIVDDDIEMRTLLRLILKREGYKILEADNGEAALDLAKVNIPNLIISDIMMENINGFMLFEFLLDDPLTQNIPMILVTGKAQNAGAWKMDPRIAYLEKPVAPIDLLDAVKKKIA